MPDQNAAAQQGSSPAAGGGGRRLRILIVDDSRDCCTVLGMLLEMDGHEVRTAHTGRAALDAARTAPPDVVLLDLGLPDLSGYEVCRRLRAQPETHSAVLIAWSGRAEPDDRARSRDAGFDHHVLKPADLDELQALFPE